MISRKAIWFIVLLFFGTTHAIFSQQQWRFHIAFEDGTGARDTIWLLYDTTANEILPTDTALGEGAFSFDHSVFNVWIYNYDNDSTKTFALPYSLYPYHDVQIHAFNYQYPILISWDTSLFMAPYLPYSQGHINYARIENSYFYALYTSHNFDMLINNHVQAPVFNWGTEDQFPMSISFSDATSISETSDMIKSVKIFPNPFFQETKITSIQPISRLEIYSEDGKTVFTENFIKPIVLTEYNLILSELEPGFYLLLVTNTQKQFYYEKVIKMI